MLTLSKLSVWGNLMPHVRLLASLLPLVLLALTFTPQLKSSACVCTAGVVVKFKRVGQRVLSDEEEEIEPIKQVQFKCSFS